MADAYIVDAVRTAGGRRNGKLAGWHPADLAGEVLDALVARTRIDPMAIDDVILGCVTQAGEQSFCVCPLDAAIEVFREHGFEGTSADMLARRLRVGRQGDCQIRL